MRKIVVAISSAAVSSALATSRRAIDTACAPASSPGRSTATCSSTSACVAPSIRTVQPGGTTTVVSYSSISNGPSTRLGSERRASAHRRGDRAVARTEARGADGLLRRALRLGPARQRQLRPRRAERDQADRPDVDRRAGLEPRAVEPLVLGLEALDECGEGSVVDLAREVDRDAPVLPAVADVGLALPFGLDAGPERGGERLPHLVVEPLQRRQVRLAGADPAEADVVELGAGEQQPGGREEPCERRHDRRPDAELGGERGRVNGAGAAVGEEHEVGRVAALLGRDRTQGAHHRAVGQVVDAACRLDRREPEPPAERRPATPRRARGRRSGRPRRAGRSGCSPSTTFASVTVGSTPPRP